MRWFVDVGTIGRPDKQSHCVEAESWQRALQAVRVIRADVGSMGGFSIELLEDGCRAVDPLARLRYELRRAPENAPLTSAAPNGASEGPLSIPSPPGGGQVPVVSPPSPSFALRPVAPPAPMAASAPPVATASAPNPFVSAPPAVSLMILARREQERTEHAPMTFRERAYLVPVGTTEESAAEQLTLAWQSIRAEIASAPAGKLVQLAAFDTPFTERPTTRPIATLTWKDWREPHVVSYPRRSHATPAQSFRVADSAPPSAPHSAPAPVAVPPAAPVPASLGREAAPPSSANVRPSGGSRSVRPVAPSWPSTPPPVEVAQAPAPPPPPPPPAAPPVVAPQVFQAPPPAPAFPVPVAVAPPPPVFPVAAPVAAPPPVAVPVAAPPPVAVPVAAPPPAAVFAVPPPASPVPHEGSSSSRPPKGPRRPSEDLIADLFEATSELHYLSDPVKAAEFCAVLSFDKLQADGCVVHLYNINRREFLAAAARGEGTASIVGQHYDEADSLLSAAMRRRRPVVLDASEIPSGSAPRLAPLGSIRSMVVAPVMQSGRFLGAIELTLGDGESRFSESDSHAVGYIAEQLAEFRSVRGATPDSERVQPVARARR